MNIWLRDAVLQQPVYLLPYLILVAVLAVVPIIKIVNLWLVERVLDIKWAVPMLLAHLVVMGVLWQMKLQGVIVLYLLLILVILLLLPLFDGVHDWLTIRGLLKRDIARYRYMLKHDPNNANALIGLANAYIQMGQEDEAIAAYEKARAVDPQNTSVVNRKLLDLINARARGQIGKKGMQPVTTDGKRFNMEEKITMEVVDKDDGPVIPEL